jgi:hypothetical protein
VPPARSAVRYRIDSASAEAGAPSNSATSFVLPALVEVTVVDATHTVLDRIVLTDGHTVTTASGGTHVCDGTNGGANPGRVPTPTAALDTAARAAQSGWDGTWYDSFSDYDVTTIAGETAGPGTYWNIAVNGTSIPVGGCQFRLHTGDRVTFTLTTF